MNNNPFTSETFSFIWSNHFCPSTEAIHFDFLKGLPFTKHHALPLYINYGKTHTKGISYDLKNPINEDIKGKVLLIYDVPAFFELQDFPKSRVKRYTTKQYPGFLINLGPYKGVNEFMAGTFKKSSRYKLKKYKKKLEACFDINYKMFYGEISKKEYDFVFENFRNLLIKRFEDKQTTNNNLGKQEWNFYQDVAYPMILEKKAGLFVIYNGNEPIGVTLCYFSDEILFDAITVFDIDYAKFHVGSTTIMKLIAWCFENKLKIFDFSKGYFDYKKRWASRQYDFEYHILYDSRSLKSRTFALGIKIFFDFKQFLREKNVNGKIHKIIFRLRNGSNRTRSNLPYKFIDVDKGHKAGELTEIDYNKTEYKFLKTIVFEYLYLINESQENLKTYRIINSDNKFFFAAHGNNVTVELNPT